ncbi:MAG: acetate uptake transporter [Ilumatobacteraceae bacterium]
MSLQVEIRSESGDGVHTPYRHVGSNEDLEFAEWEDRTRVVLEPIAAPSILGLYGFAGATFIVAAHLAGWYGDSESAFYLFPFAAFFGGLAQFIAGLYAFRARDALATAMHGMWGSFWLGYGVLYAFFATGVLVEPAGDFPELGFWFLALGAITLVGAIAAMAENVILAGVLTSLAGGAVIAAIANLAGNSGAETLAGYFFIVAAGLAFYLASAMMLESTYGQVVLPTGKWNRAANILGRHVTHPIEYEQGMPGVRQGQ